MSGSHSPLLCCYHPTAEQRRREAAAWRENLKWWSRLAAQRGGNASKRDADEAADEDEIERAARPVAPEREVVALVGLVLWDVFSDNHTVFDAAGEFDLGSFRGAAGFLAEELNLHYRRLDGRRGYLDLYLGTTWIGRRADLCPVYRWVFTELRAAGCDWRYSFPRLYLVSFTHDAEPADNLAYNPSAAVAADLEAAERA